jgi:hypothetical protein
VQPLLFLRKDRLRDRDQRFSGKALRGARQPEYPAANRAAIMTAQSFTTPDTSATYWSRKVWQRLTALVAAAASGLQAAGV